MDSNPNLNLDPTLIQVEALEKHQYYASKYIPNDIYWGIGIENEVYFEMSKPLEIDIKTFYTKNAKRERYSVNYFTSYRPGVYESCIYKLKLDELKQVILYDAFDGAPYVELTTNNRVSYIDLSVPIYHLNVYDWIISLEVAEHIPAQFESIYINNLVKHAKEGIILSWAKEGQGGHSHVNNKNADYVINLMKSKNFSHDLQSSNNLKLKSSLPWFKDNINVFRRN